MNDNTSVTTGQIVGLFTECIIYGVYLVTLAQCLQSLLWSNTENSFKKTINWRMLAVALSMALVATLDVTCGVRQNLDAFVYYTGPGGAAVEFADVSSWYNVIKIADGIAQIFFGDAMLIYRCYLVYDRRGYFAAPFILLWIAEIITGVLGIVIFTTSDATTFQNASRVKPYVASALALTLAINVLTTSLIVYRIWSVDRQAAQTRVHFSGALQLRSIIRIIIESAALYTVSLIICLGIYIADGNAGHISVYSLVQIIGISFNLIFIRVNSGRAYEGTTKWNAATSINFAPVGLSLSTFHARSAGSVASANPPLEISIQQEFIQDPKGSLGQADPHERTMANLSAA